MVYKCLDGRLAVEEDNRIGVVTVRRYLTALEVRELEKKMKKLEKLQQLRNI